VTDELAFLSSSRVMGAAGVWTGRREARKGHRLPSVPETLWTCVTQPWIDHLQLVF
jgi:hypothetical protein